MNFGVMVQFQNTPKPVANFSPGFEEREPWGAHIRGVLNPDGGLKVGEPFQSMPLVIFRSQGCRKLQPCAEISDRLQRIFKLNQYQFWQLIC